MALFDNLKEKVTDLAQSGAAKTKQLAEIAKLKTANMAEEDAIKKAYMEMGKLYYAEKGDAPDAAYAALCEKVTASKSVIAANKARMQELKSESGDTEVSEAVDAEVVDAEVVEDGEDCGCCCGSAEDKTEE